MKPSWLSRIRRWIGLLAVTAFSCVLLLFLVVVGAIVQYPVRALLWHCTHPKDVSVGNVRLTLPLSWWRGADEGGKIVLKRAKIDGRLAFMPGELDLLPLDTDAAAIRDLDEKGIEERLVTGLHGKGPQTFVPLVISAPAGKIFCGIDRLIPALSSLYCFSPQIRLKIFFGAGSIQEESEAESILATLR